jgi:hypothetical protein
MRTLPRPLPDEFAYSALGRATVRYGLTSPKRLLDLLYGRRTLIAVPDLPSNLAALAMATQESWQLSAEELALRHTLVSYYTHFRGAQQTREVLTHMAADAANLQVRLGVCAGAALAPKWFRLCRCCHAEDIARYGEPFWHRAHHLPGVLVCHLHGEVLAESDVPFRPKGRHEYRAAPIELRASQLRPLMDGAMRFEVARAVALRSMELLDAQACAQATLPDYRSALAQYGFSAGWGSADRFRAAFIDYFGEEFLRASFGFREGDSLAWLADVLRRPRRLMHPFKHVLMTVFLEGLHAPAQEQAQPIEQRCGKRWGLYRSPQMRKEAASLAQFGLTTHAVATALDVDWKTAHRLLAPVPVLQPAQVRDSGVDRQVWEQMAAAHASMSKKALRRAAPALYARLYRNDRAWLLAWQPAEVVLPAVAGRVDWRRRDLKLESQVQEGVARILQELPPRRASRNYVLGVLGVRALVAHRAALLPRTSAALRALCESVEDFQLRRVTQVLVQGDWSAPDWRVMREAGIQPHRFVDSGRGLLERARTSAAQMRRDGGASR